MGKSWETLWQYKMKAYVSEFKRKEWIAKTYLNVIEHWNFTVLWNTVVLLYIFNLFELDFFIRLMAYFVFHR